MAAPDRTERSRIVAGRVCEYLANSVDPAVWSVPPFVDAIADPADAVLAALLVWEESGSAEHEQAVRDATDRLIES